MGEPFAEGVEALLFLEEEFGAFALWEVSEVGAVQVVGRLGAAEAGGSRDGAEGLPLAPRVRTWSARSSTSPPSFEIANLVNY